MAGLYQDEHCHCHHRHQSHHKDCSETIFNATEIKVYSKPEEKYHNSLDQLGQLRSLAADTYALCEKNKVGKVPRHANGYEIEEEKIVVAAGADVFSFKYEMKAGKKADGHEKKVENKTDGYETKVENKAYGYEKKADGYERKVEKKADGYEKKVEKKADGYEKKVEKKADGCEKKADGYEKKVEKKANGCEKKMEKKVKANEYEKKVEMC
ncbi:uncharacterized protein LOC133317579 [Gastrolobium bilobum]|uniref:uncharacterized protein LOC133317579 n=1 Tax=Gastrolobium bilobum TaxID=150636 RepID=UPI002AB013E5|nr:uncharacterized protein LOC133317579 [Gastrolobium bilobum]